MNKALQMGDSWKAGSISPKREISFDDGADNNKKRTELRNLHMQRHRGSYVRHPHKSAYDIE